MERNISPLDTRLEDKNAEDHSSNKYWNRCRRGYWMHNGLQTIIREGEYCNPPIFGGPPPTSQCEEGTRCTYVEYYGTTICVGDDYY
ncbi:hypothetical protein TNCT_307671 [Trichonephila clavata]|uniref:Uncharacterized protein n=1 Tax=Trichonephila clavata TaxID=2740835 RepID=A0A8X6I905_TRICU|nr:hypothetical protein TNCT_307671 [Trichonephila clavata]